MQPIWALALILAIFFLVLRFRGVRKGRPEVKMHTRRVEGTQIVTVLHPRVGAACLADHGIQYGKGFRRKEGPALPHDGECRCEERYFSFTSTEVFHGALRKGIAPRPSIEGLNEAETLALLDTLRAWGSGAPAESADAALAKTDLARFTERSRKAVELFLRERFAFLALTGGKHAPRTA